MGPTPVLVTYLSALLTPVIAALGSYIAWQQWRTAKDKLALDLFDRRLKVVSATKQAMAEVLRNDKVDFQQVMEFLQAWNDAPFLFESDVTDFLETTRKRLNALRANQARRDAKAGTEQEKAFERELELLEQLNKFNTELDSLAHRYMDLHHKTR